MKYLMKIRNQMFTGMIVFAAAMFMFVTNPLEAYAYIQTQGTVVSESAVVRKDPSSNSNVIASLMSGDSVTINNEETDSNGVVWYKVFVNADTLGYVRGDLIKKSGASAPITNTPSTSNENNSSSTTTQEINKNVTVGATTQVTPIESQGATVTNDKVRVRAEASTDSAIVTQVKKSTAVTVNGQANGTDGKVWYKISFVADGSEVTGFIRYDFVRLSSEVVVIDENETSQETEETVINEEVVPEDEPVVEPVNNDYELKYETDADGNSDWYLYNNVEGVKNSLTEFMSAADTNEESLIEAEKLLKKQKMVIVALAIIIVFMLLAITLLFFKVKDADYEEFEDFDEKPVKQANNNNQAPRNVRPSNGQQRPSNGQQQRPSNGQQQRPANGQQRPSNGQQQRPANGQQQRPSNGQQQRPANSQQQRPANGQGQRPANGQQRPANGQQQRPANSQQRPANSQNSATNEAGWKAKNFMTEDDEFEFEFLNWSDNEDV